MQIAVLLSAAVPSPPGSVPAAEGEVSFEAHLQAAQAQQETLPEPPDTAAHPAPEVTALPQASAEAEAEVVPPAEVLPSAVPIQEWEALAWVQQHVPPVAPPPVVVLPPPVQPVATPIPVSPQPALLATGEISVPTAEAPAVLPPDPAASPKAEAVSPATLVIPDLPEADPVPVPQKAEQVTSPHSENEMPASHPSSPAPDPKGSPRSGPPALASSPDALPRSGPEPEAEPGPQSAEFVDSETPMPAPAPLKSEPPASLPSAAPIPPAPLSLTPLAPSLPLAQAAGLALEKPLRALAARSPASADQGAPTDLRAPLRAEEGAAALGLSLSSSASPREITEAAAVSRTPPALAARFELVQQMGERIRLLHYQGAQEVRVSLNPAHLGQVDIHLSRQEGHYHLHMVAETPLAKELLESQLGQLKQHLGQQGLLLDQASVDLGGQSEQGKQPAQEQPVPTGAAAAFKLFPDADDTQEDGVPAALPAPESAVNYLA